MLVTSLICLYVWLLHVCLCTNGTVPSEASNRHQLPANGAADWFELLSGFWTSSLSPLEEQKVLLTTKSCLQPTPYYIFKHFNCFFGNVTTCTKIPLISQFLYIYPLPWQHPSMIICTPCFSFPSSHSYLCLSRLSCVLLAFMSNVL